MSSRACAHCGNTFNARGPQKWCKNCSMVTFNCATCGKPKTIKRSRYERPDLSPDSERFCSRKCAVYKGSQIAAEQRMNGSMVTCPNCGKSNYRSDADQARTFCDHSCYMSYRILHPEEYPLKIPSALPQEQTNMN